MCRKRRRGSSYFGLIISVFAALVAIVALITALAAVFEKRRKDEEELERYLDGSIQ